MVLHVVEKKPRGSVDGVEGAEGWGEIQGSQGPLTGLRGPFLREASSGDNRFLNLRSRFRVTYAKKVVQGVVGRPGYILFWAWCKMKRWPRWQQDIHLSAAPAWSQDSVQLCRSHVLAVDVHEKEPGSLLDVPANVKHWLEVVLVLWKVFNWSSDLKFLVKSSSSLFY